MASILDEFHARSEADRYAWHYAIGAFGSHITAGESLTPEQILSILRRSEAFGQQSLDRKGFERNETVDAYFDGLRAAAAV